ncbi:MAG: type II toxin-antitoxin system VapC family toxin [Verrucomicrobia bacterium]|nr:type II toxin-antitoxin system VapC family toxin [Verrucomicrobiota bacterium]
MSPHNGFHFVLDCSITMAWLFEDETTQYTETILDQLSTHTAIVPTIWPLEVANVLVH